MTDETGMVSHTVIEEIVSLRDASIAKAGEAMGLFRQAHAALADAKDISARAWAGHKSVADDRSGLDVFRAAFRTFDTEDFSRVFREHIDVRVWSRIMEETGAYSLMDQTARDVFRKGLQDDVGEVSVENVRATIEGLVSSQGEIFWRGVAVCFGNLDRRFKSHNAFKIGSRVILTNVFDFSGFMPWQRKGPLTDLERVFTVLDGKPFDKPQLIDAITGDRSGYSPQQSMTETDYFRVRVFKNGNVHLWMTRNDLVKKVNQGLADWYGEVLPDAVTPDDENDQVLKSGSTALAKDLSFYGTPDKVSFRMLDRSDLNGRVLEPSAGAGGLVFPILKWDRVTHVEAIEVDPSRIEALRGIRDPRLNVRCGNFLTMTPKPIFDYVIMNPPFYGTHWIDHIMHAMEWLNPTGRLIAIVPMTARTGTTKKHKAFQKFAEIHKYNWMSAFTDLATGSFSSSGTNVSTTICEIRKRPYR